MPRTWYCAQCGKPMGVGRDALQVDKLDGKLFCSDLCAINYIRDSNNTDEVLDALDPRDVTLEDEP